MNYCEILSRAELITTGGGGYKKQVVRADLRLRMV